VGCDRVYTRRMTRKIAYELQKVKIELETETHDISVEKPPMKIQRKRNKGKKHVSYPSRPKTRPKNKLRINSKAPFKPSLKKEKLIIIDDDDILEKIPDITKK
jgi:hypothetical protein